MSGQPQPISAFETRSLDRLRAEGFRITMPRILVIRALAESPRALSAYAIHERVQDAGGRIDIVSVYRTLSTLVEMGLIHHVGVVDGYLACGVDEHHGPASEHLVCRSCGKVTEIAVSAELVESAQRQSSAVGFRPQEMRIEVLGFCADCA